MNTELSTWWNKQCSIGNNKKYLVTCDGNAVAGFDRKDEAEVACEMYAKRSFAQMKKSSVEHVWKVSFKLECER